MHISLSSVVNYKKGKMPLEFSESGKPGYVPYIDIKLFDKGILSRFAKCDSKVTLVNKDDVLVVWDGARFGLSAIGWEGALGSTIVALNSQYVLPKFLFYFIQSNFEKIQSKPRGVGIPHVEPSLFWNLEIPVPPMEEQKRIVKKIEELFGIIDKQVKRLETAQDALISYRQSVLQHYLSSDRRPEHTFGEVILKIIGGSTPSKSHVEYYQGNIPFMTVKDMTSEYLQDTAWHITQEAVKNSSTNIVPPNTLIIATRVGLGKIVRMSKAVAINQDLKGLILKKDVVDQTFFKYILKYKTSEILRRSRGTTVKGITLEDFKTIPFSLPTLPKQKAIVKKIETAFAFADKAQEAISASLEQAKRLKQSILKMAFEGKLVSQDPNDKPIDLSKIKKDK